MLSDRRAFKYTAAALTAAAVITAAGWAWHQGESVASATYGGDLIRFHVIAESDSPRDQAIKLKVRDEVIQVMRPVLAGAGNVDEARQRIDGSLDLIAGAATGVLRENGSAGTVRVMRGNYDFPLKTYRVESGSDGEVKELTLPAGEYEAVRVVLGEGRGANWWCVLFPPLCFASAAPESPPGEKAVGAAADEGIEYRLKVVEWLKDKLGDSPLTYSY